MIDRSAASTGGESEGAKSRWCVGGGAAAFVEAPVKEGKRKKCLLS
jgi:hypothetical protein